MSTETETNPAKININFDLTEPELIKQFLDYKQSTGLIISNATIARKVMAEGLRAMAAPKRRVRQ